MGRGSQTVRVKVEVPVKALSVEICCDCSARRDLGQHPSPHIIFKSVNESESDLPPLGAAAASVL